MSDIKYMDIAEFRRDGYLQEVNRKILHPLGLALEVMVDDDGTEYLGGIWDYRDDEEGMGFNWEGMDTTEVRRKARVVQQLREEKRPARERIYGSHIQPLPPREES